MAFRIHTIDGGHAPAAEYLPCGAITPKAGMLLKFEEGALSVATGTDVPTYLSFTQREEACTPGELIPVVRIRDDMIFEVPTPVSFALKPGAEATLGNDGLTITGTAGGCAEIVLTNEEFTRIRLA